MNFFKKSLAIIFMNTIFVCGVLAGTTFSEGEKLALLAKPAVVRIYDGYVGTARWESNTFSKTYQLSYLGSGSGALIAADGYIVTNSHVVIATKEGDAEAMKHLLYSFASQVAKDYKTTVNQLTESDWNAIEEAFRRSVGYKHIHDVVLASGTSFPFEIKSFGAPTGDGKDVAVIKIEIRNAPVLKLGDSDKVRVQDHITVVGYPAAGESEVLDQQSLLQPSITDGKVSARKNTTDGAPVLEVSAPATHGSSGGPVLNDEGEIVGLMTFGGDLVRGQEIQGFNFIVTSNTVKEFLVQAGATNEGGTADKNYRDGLELYRDQRYSAALEKFEKVQKLFPQHSEVTSLIQDCEAKIETEGSSWFWIILGSVVAAGLFGAASLTSAMIFLVVRSKGMRPQFT